MKPKILITPQAFNKLDNTIDSILGADYNIIKTGGQLSNKDEIISRLRDCDGCIIGAEKIDNDIFEKCKSLKILSRFGSGYNSINLTAAEKYNVVVAYVPNNNARAVARHALSLLLSITNNIIDQNNMLKNGKWEKSFNISPELSKIGIVGLGMIGNEFAYLCNLLGFEVHYFSRSNKKNENYIYHDSISSLIKSVDIVSIHLVCNEQTKNIFDNSKIKLLNGKILINTSRGELIDEEALFDSLSSRKIIAAGIDVFTNEPYSGISKKLAMLNNVVSTSHTSCYDYYSIEQVGKSSLENIKYFFDGKIEKIKNIVKN